MACSKIATKLETILECGICKDIVQKPQRLACFHSFCKTCINKQPKHKEGEETGVLCPICKAFNGDKQVNSSFLVDELLDAYCIAQDGDHKCQQCAKNNAKWNCLECKMDFCEDCKLNHLKIPLLRNHRFVDRTTSSDVVVDRLVFCETHRDEPIKFNCKTCDGLICIMCKVTKHESHETEAIQETIDRILPEVKTNTSKLEEKVKALDQNHVDILAKMVEIKESYAKCKNEAKNNMNKVIKNAKAQHAEVVKQLDDKEKEELATLKAAKIEVENKKKELSHICEWVNTSTDVAKGVTLVAEMQGGLYNRVSDVAKPKYKKPVCVKTPALEANFTKEGMQNMIGNVKYKTVRVSSNKNIGSGKTPPIPFSQLFSKKRQQGKQINLPNRATRMDLVNGDIWVPVPNSAIIQVYDTDGNEVRKIQQGYSPYSVKQAENGDIILASSTGLYVIDEDGTILSTLSTGVFYDVAINGDKLVAIHCNSRQMQIYKKENEEWVIKAAFAEDHGCYFNREDTLAYYNEQVYVTCKNYQQFIQQYDENTRQLVLNHNIRAGYSTPFICGSEEEGNMLISFGDNNMYYVLNTNGQWENLTNPGFNYACDVICGEEGSVWVLDYNNTLTQYTYK